jgi:uncharacterized protein YciI
MTLEEVLAKVKPYTLVLLKTGINQNMKFEEQQRNHAEHVQYLLGLREQGVLAINGPIADEAEVIAVSIYNSADRDQVKTWVENDPGIKSGRFTYEILRMFGFPGDKLGS